VELKKPKPGKDKPEPFIGPLGGGCNEKRRNVGGRPVFEFADCRFKPHFEKQPNCKGKCADGKKCGERATFEWRITDTNPAGCATIQQGADQETVTVRITSVQCTYRLRLRVSVQCRCGGRDVGRPCEDEAEQERRFRSG
jgi:hypothetical protein